MQKSVEKVTGDTDQTVIAGEVAKKKNKKKNKQKAVIEEETKEMKNENAHSDTEEIQSVSTEATDASAAAVKKKKKKKSKDSLPREQDNSQLRGIGNWKAGPYQQTDPPTKPISQQFTKGHFPEGEILEHALDHNRHRITDAELRDKEKLTFEDYDDLRRAAEVHRQTRKHAQKFIKPGMKIMDICNEIEATNRKLIEASGLEAGIAFPTGASINHCAAHYTPNIGDQSVLQYGDIMKIDYGSHVKGLLTDCAFTVAFDPVYDNLIAAVKDATNTGIRAAGIDVRLTDIGEQIQETMESYEVEIGNKTYPVKCIRNLNGHNIARWRIHAGKQVPIVKNGDERRMEEGEQYAIETFGSTGNGVVYNGDDCSHYMMKFDAEVNPPGLKDAKAKALLGVIRQNFSTLAFCRKWLEEFYPKHFMPLKSLVDANIVRAYPPLNDISGCFTAQFEHTILLRPTCKEVLTRGDDF